jgi:putative ABC transport system substrate-binding protein
MNRRDFFRLTGSACLGWPLAAGAQQRKVPVIGFLHADAPEARMHQVEAFRKGLAETGFTEGNNVAIEFRWARDNPTRFKEMAAELVQRDVAVIVTPVGTAAAVATKATTSIIPIVFSIGTDAVKAGLVASYNRPGGNVTGVASMISELGDKRLELLLELRPQAKRIGLLINANNPAVAETATRAVEAAASARGVELEIVKAATSREVDAAFATLAERRADGLVVSPDPLFGGNRSQLATLSVRHALPAVFPFRDFAMAGGLISYGPDDAARYRLVGVYAGRVLKGEKPADMPVQQPTAFQLVINLQTARVLGVTVPPTLLARADEVIE